MGIDVYKNRKLIGRRERVDLPELMLKNVVAKIDSGAYTSSIHIERCHIIEENDKKRLAVVFLDKDHPSFNPEVIHFDHWTQKKVKSSTGESRMRYFIKTSIRIGNETLPIDFSLTTRHGMKYPILLGRKFVNKRFLIDTSKINLLELS